MLGVRRRSTGPRCSSRSTASPASTSGCCDTTTANARSLVESATARGHAARDRAGVPPRRSTPATSGSSSSTARSSGRSTGSRRTTTSGSGRRRPPSSPTSATAHVVGALAPHLRRLGIVLAGLDVIDGRLIEVNVTCPGGMHKTDALLGTDLSGAIMRRLLHPTPKEGSSHEHRSRSPASPCSARCCSSSAPTSPGTGPSAARTGNQMPTDPADRMFIAHPGARQRGGVRPHALRPAARSAARSRTAGGSTCSPSPPSSRATATRSGC